MTSRRSLNHKIWDIAWPAILSNLSIPLLGLVDTAILGHLGSTLYLGAVAVGAALLAFLYWGFSFLRMGTTGLVAKAMGADRSDTALLVLAQSCVLALILAVLVWLVHPLWLGVGLDWMSPPVDVAPLAHRYASIRIYSAPAVLLTYACVGWFIGRTNTRWPMAIVLLTNLANILLDFVFIVGLGLNSEGAALATVLAEYLGAALALYGVWKHVPKDLEPAFFRPLRRFSAYRPLLRANRHLFVRTVCLLFSFAFFTAMSGRYGADVLAANSIMLQLLMLAAYGLDGFAYAAEALTGTRLGERNLEGFRRAVYACAAWCATAALLACAMFAVAHVPLFGLFTDLEVVQRIMFEHRWWLIVLPLVAAPSYLLDGVFIGASETRYMMYTMLLCTCALYLPLWYYTQGLGTHGLWLAFTTFNGARGLSLYLCYLWLDRHEQWLQSTESDAN